tara:strand:+ start:8703 stop:10664 length:1962 start_codon:yes stop_codon:yes gene_type:complete
MGYKNKSSYFNLIKESASNAIIKKKFSKDAEINDKFKKAKSLISKIKDSKIRDVFQNELDTIQQSGGTKSDSIDISELANSAKDLRNSSLGKLTEKAIGSTPMGAAGINAMDKIIKQGTDIAKKAGIDEKTLNNVIKQGSDILANTVDTVAKTSADAINKSAELTNEVSDTNKTSNPTDNDNDNITEVNKDGNNISVRINVTGSGKKKDEETNETETEKSIETVKPTEIETIDKPSVIVAGQNFGDNTELPKELSDNDEADKKQQNPSYPKELQIFPLNSHSMKKKSKEYSIYLDNIKSKIDVASNAEASQNALIEINQEKIDADMELKKKEIGKQELQNSKNFPKKLAILQRLIERCTIAIWSIIKKIGKIIYRALFLFIEFCKSHPVALICWVIAVIIFIFLLVFLIFGAEISYNTRKNSDEPNKENNKVQCSNNYNSCGSEVKFNFKQCFDNPLQYSFNYFKTSINDYKGSTILNKLFYNSLYTASSVLKGTTGISFIENNKFDRPINKENEADIQRVDNISFIDYDILNDKIKNNIYKSTNDDNDKNTAISLIKPKNIEWKLPHIDYYSTDTDANKLPESIKKYKNKNDEKDYSLNDTSTLVFPWNIEGDKYVLDCNAGYKNLDNKILSNLYETDGIYCVSKSKPNPVN